ncbi:hypothetical protein JQ596_20340 [Bradyrhizobium manausense]|uniref:hypothetical protein n=1 Tax=Bradyrhizobium TaxID=374 RepID=UPI001BAE2CFE|nr:MULTISPECIES: hypothetical protein [Bradyrhizobium]MBR0827885.1 hypothetical protein [Bradyrhizobium manausense]UVO32760.1 hypothetical protein KUF59_20140 [Bradyrhizobium arachidis]
MKRSAVWFALVGPAVGFAMMFAVSLARLSWQIVMRRSDAVLLDDSLASTALGFVTVIPVLLIGAYVVGAPAAFAVGAATRLMSDRAVSTLWIVAASLLIGAGISMATIYGLDEFVIPHPHLDSAPMFGPRMWVIVGAVGAASAVMCTLAAMRR